MWQPWNASAPRRRTGVLVAGAVAACVPLALGQSVATAATPPVPVTTGATGVAPQAPQPARADGFTAYVPQTSCDPVAKPGVAAFRDLVTRRYPGTADWGITRNCAADGVSEHLDGRAWDWNADVRNPAQYAAATDLLNWLTASGPDGRPAYNARRVGLLYIVYNKRIFGLYRASEGWRKLSSGSPHVDHVHFSFSWEGAYKRTSFWSGKAAAIDYGPCRPYAGQPAPLYSSGARNTSACRTPPPVPTGFAAGPLLWMGSSGAEVGTLQRTLGVLPVSGTFGPITQKAVIAYQKANRLPTTGVFDAATRTAARGGNGAPRPGPVLRVGSRGKEVRAIQRALRVRPVTGKFGRLTKKAVKRLQRRSNLPISGVVDRATRQLLFARNVLRRP